MKNRIVLAYDAGAVAADADASARDVLDQLDAIEKALAGTEYSCARLGVDLDFVKTKERLRRDPDARVFNLVESLDGSDRLQTLFPLLLEEWGIRFTGAGSLAMLYSNNKLLAKRIMRRAGLPTATACYLDTDGAPVFHPGDAEPPETRPGKWIVKPLECHASLHIDDDAVAVCASARELEERLRRAEATHGARFFAERFIDGREFNLSLVEVEDGVVVLPPAEIDFSALPPEKPRIVGYAAKWRENSLEYAATPRAFGTLADDAGLEGELRDLALDAWNAFSLRGYARVDFRVDDATGFPMLLEVNANPCLAPDAGLAAAAERYGWDFRELCRRIVASAGI